jgi:hypothetical protein
MGNKKKIRPGLSESTPLKDGRQLFYLMILLLIASIVGNDIDNN